MPLRFQPGTAYMYSLATDVCGALVEPLSGVPFAEYLQRHILGPLGMADTSFQVAADKLPRFAANYARKPDKTTTLLDDPAVTLTIAPGTHPLRKDLAALDVDLLTLYGNVGVGFGLGFASTIDQVATGALARGDYYWGGAASTVFWVDPIEDLWVVFMTQLMPSVSFDFRGQLRSLVYSAIVD